MRSCRWELDASEVLRPSTDLATAAVLLTEPIGPMGVSKLLDDSVMPHATTLRRPLTFSLRTVPAEYERIGTGRSPGSTSDSTSFAMEDGMRNRLQQFQFGCSTPSRGFRNLRNLQRPWFPMQSRRIHTLASVHFPKQ